MRISELFKKIPHFVLQGDTLSIKEITGICEDSRKCCEGSLFVCVRGEECDGHDYISDAINAGSCAIVVDDLSKIAYITDKELIIILVENTRMIMSQLSAAWFGYPADKLFTIGITGTKGKSTTAHMVKAILDAAGIKTGLLGTILMYDGKVSTNNVNTTPSAYEVQKWMARMVDNECKAVVMEVSSQGMKHYRCDAIEFDIAAFTNLKPDHIGTGEHKDFAEYRFCKSQLFRKCRLGIFNFDDEHTSYMTAKATCNKKYYSLKDTADYIVSDIRKYKKNGVGMRFKYQDTQMIIPFPGIFNVYNALCAIAITSEYGIERDIIADALNKVIVRGRCEYINVSEDFHVLLDYAHNAMSLKTLLQTIREYEPGRIICLFGCGGNRSRARRFEMGEVSGRFADYTVITSDNPRDEEPLKIIDDIVDGIKKTSGKYMVISDRERAIKHAIDIATKGDIVIVAGKGHETYQEIKKVRYYMDDKEIILRNKR